MARARSVVTTLLSCSMVTVHSYTRTRAHAGDRRSLVAASGGGERGLVAPPAPRRAAPVRQPRAAQAASQGSQGQLTYIR
eukprot:716504-Pyramimonas_sp.AAC.1